MTRVVLPNWAWELLVFCVNSLFALFLLRLGLKIKLLLGILLLVLFWRFGAFWESLGLCRLYIIVHYWLSSKFFKKNCADIFVLVVVLQYWATCPMNRMQLKQKINLVSHWIGWTILPMRILGGKGMEVLISMHILGYQSRLILLVWTSSLIGIHMIEVILNSMWWS